MHEYDIALKSILTRPEGSALQRVTGFAVTRWHNAELPQVRSRRADLLGETARGGLRHIELQSTNHPRMALRMLEYSSAIYRIYGRFPEQAVLYVGNAPLRMKDTLKGPKLSFECSMTDIRELDSEPLLASRNLDDNVLAILFRLADETVAVKRILVSIAQHDPAQRAAAIAELMILAGLRKLGTVIEQEIEQMPILNDIMDHEVIGRERKIGMALGREEGREEGERLVVLRMIARRFGPVSEWAREQVQALSPRDLERVELKLLDAKSLEDLFA